MSVKLARWSLRYERRYAISSSSLILLISSISTHARATATGIFVEGVDNFPASSCCADGICFSASNLGNSQTNSQGFLDQMLASPNSWQLTYNTPWYNDDCGTSDYYDPQMTGQVDEDYKWFDAPSTYASYVTAHGMCPDTNTPEFGDQCWHDSECASHSPPAGERQPGTCVRWPWDNYGRCRYSSDRRIILGNRTAGPPNRCGIVNYTSGNVKWGENPYIQGNPGWAGAGTNGGTHLAVLDISCAELSGRHQEIFPAFAGMHMLATTLVVKGDMANVPDRGRHFASHYTANPNGIVSNSWNDTLNSENWHQNAYCHARGILQPAVGGLGYNGCGAQSVTALGATAAEAHSLVGETWYDLRWDGRSATGASYYEQWYACNYDCYTWTFNMP